MPEERIPKLIMDWLPWERRKRGRPRKTWMGGIQATMTTRNLEPDQGRNREEWRSRFLPVGHCIFSVFHRAYSHIFIYIHQHMHTF